MGIFNNVMWIIIYSLIFFLLLFVFRNKIYIIHKMYLIPSVIINIVISITVVLLNNENHRDINIGIPFRYLIMYYKSNGRWFFERYNIAFHIIDFGISIFITIFVINVLSNIYRILRRKFQARREN